MLTNWLAACTHLFSTVSQLFEPQVQKITIFTYRSPHFCFPWRRLCDYHAKCCMDGKTIQCLPNASQHVPICLQYFLSYTMLKSIRKSKNRYFYHIFVSPGEASGTITLRANKLSPSINKTSYSIFGKHANDEHNTTIHLCNNDIQEVNCCKYLGVYVDNTLLWKNHHGLYTVVQAVV